MEDMQILQGLRKHENISVEVFTDKITEVIEQHGNDLERITECINDLCDYDVDYSNAIYAGIVAGLIIGQHNTEQITERLIF